MLKEQEEAKKAIEESSSAILFIHFDSCSDIGDTLRFVKQSRAPLHRTLS